MMENKILRKIITIILCMIGFIYSVLLMVIGKIIRNGWACDLLKQDEIGILILIPAFGMFAFCTVMFFKFYRSLYHGNEPTTKN